MLDERKKYRIGLWISTILLWLLFSAIPKELIAFDTLYGWAVGGAYEENNLVLYKYQVYATEEKYQKGLEEIEAVRKKFQEENEILAVKVHGEGTGVREKYVLFYDTDVPEKNIEYYYVKNIALFGSDIPCKSFLTFAENLAEKINTVYRMILYAFITAISAWKTIKIGKAFSSEYF